MKLVAAVSLLAVLTGAMVANAQDDRYWELGAGAYFGGTSGMTDLDVARYDWIYVCFGNISANEETAALIDRLLQINPELRIVLRLWPIMGKGDCPENRYQATFLHYLYDPEVRQAVDDEIRRQFDVIARQHLPAGEHRWPDLPRGAAGALLRAARCATGRSPGTWSASGPRSRLSGVSHWSGTRRRLRGGARSGSRRSTGSTVR